MKREGYIPETVQAVEKLLYFFMRRCAVGVLCFFGDEAFPGTEELFSMMRTGSGEYVRVSGGSKKPFAVSVTETVEYVDRLIEAAGGLELIRDVCREFERKQPRQAKLLKDAAYIGKSFAYPTIDSFAKAHRVSVKKYYTVRHQAVSAIAWECYRRKRAGS